MPLNQLGEVAIVLADRAQALAVAKITLGWALGMALIGFGFWLDKRRKRTQD